jgi:hypothetical protein
MIEAKLRLGCIQPGLIFYLSGGKALLLFSRNGLISSMSDAPD